MNGFKLGAWAVSAGSSTTFLKSKRARCASRSECSLLHFDIHEYFSSEVLVGAEESEPPTDVGRLGPLAGVPNTCLSPVVLQVRENATRREPVLMKILSAGSARFVLAIPLFSARLRNTTVLVLYLRLGIGRFHSLTA